MVISCERDQRPQPADRHGRAATGIAILVRTAAQARMSAELTSLVATFRY
jgi:hypothetical protein